MNLFRLSVRHWLILTLATIFTALFLIVILVTITAQSLSTFTSPHKSLVITCVQPPANVVSWWQGDNNANDVVGTNNGSLQNVTFMSGQAGQAFNFNGTNSFVNIPNSTSLDAISNEITVAAWINPLIPPAPPLNGTGAGRGAIFARRDPNVSESFELDIRADGRLSVIVRTTNSQSASGSVFISANPVIQFNNQWKHVAATVNTSSGLVKGYVNGQQIPLVVEFGSEIVTGQMVNVNNLYFGRRQDSSVGGEGVAGAAHYKGLID